MAMLYNLDPFSAMEIFYGGEKNGVWNGDIIKNEKKRGLVLPYAVREFMENFGYLDVNRNEGSFQFFHPDDMWQFGLETDSGEVPIIVIGIFGNYLLGIRTDTEELKAAFGERTDDGTEWSPADVNFSGILTTMFVSLLFKSEGHEIYKDGYEIYSEIKKQGGERSKILPGYGCPQHFSLNYNEENERFYIAEFEEYGVEIVNLHTAPKKVFTLDELEKQFIKEFYENSMNCDYNHALQIQLKIMEGMKDAEPLDLVHHYKLAARCFWALGKSEEAVSWYEKGLSIVESHLEDAPDQVADFYHAMANFFEDTKQYEKSEEYYGKELAVLQKYFPKDVYKIGRIYQSQATFLVRNKENPERAIEACNKALEEFQKNPKDCKYEIARTQQLRGEAKRLKKELNKA